MWQFISTARRSETGEGRERELDQAHTAPQHSIPNTANLPSSFIQRKFLKLTLLQLYGTVCIYRQVLTHAVCVANKAYLTTPKLDCGGIHFIVTKLIVCRKLYRYTRKIYLLLFFNSEPLVFFLSYKFAFTGHYKNYSTLFQTYLQNLAVRTLRHRQLQERERTGKGYGCFPFV